MFRTNKHRLFLLYTTSFFTALSMFYLITNINDWLYEFGHQSSKLVYKTKYIVIRESIHRQWMSDRNPFTEEIIKTQLNNRKLVLFSVNKVNEKFNQFNTSCLRFWANPLNIQYLEVVKTSVSTITFTITFIIEPGYMPFQAVIEQNINRKHLYTDFELGKQNELQLISGKLLELPYFYNSSDCYKFSLPNHDLKEFFSQTCVCGNTNKTEVLLNKTREARSEWNKTDIELFSWLPDAPMFPTNYITFGKQDIYLHSPDFTNYCNSKLKMIILVSSAPTHFTHRKLIRKTYGNKTLLLEKNVSLAFLFGKVHSITLQANISKEITEFGDIIQADFIDSYHNLTLSHLSMYNWIYTVCKFNKPKWLLKVDDDMLINVDLALKIADANPDIPLIGYTFCGTVPIRNTAYMTKYYVPKYMYQPDYYVCYLSGLTYLIHTSWIPRFLQAALTTPIIHMDDAYITGLLPLQIGICLASFPTSVGYDNNQTSCLLQQTVGSSMMGKDMYRQWKILNSPAVNCTANISLKVIDSEANNKATGCIFYNRSVN